MLLSLIHIYPESDPFTKVIVHGTYNSTVANTWFEVKSPDGKIYYYGNTPGARQSYTAGGSPKIYAWYLDYVEDPLGNYMNYTYNQWNYYMYPGSITYGKNKNGRNSLLNKITFHYEIRSNDPCLLYTSIHDLVSQSGRFTILRINPGIRVSHRLTD